MLALSPLKQVNLKLLFLRTGKGLYIKSSINYSYLGKYPTANADAALHYKF